VGFSDARSGAIKALQEGRIQHEIRAEIGEKNLLLTGVVTPTQVVALLKACRGTQHSCSPHHQAPNVEVHVFRPEIGQGASRKRWYIKLYFVEPDVCFISVHQ
jgi:molybdopterin-binding protein